MIQSFALRKLIKFTITKDAQGREHLTVYIYLTGYAGVGATTDATPGLNAHYQVSILDSAGSQVYQKSKPYKEKCVMIVDVALLFMCQVVQFVVLAFKARRVGAGNTTSPYTNWDGHTSTFRFEPECG